MTAEREAYPVWTLVITVHNEREAILSTLTHLVRSQDMTDGEIVVVDDRSSDGTPEGVRALALPWVRLLRSEPTPEPGGLTTRQVALDLGIRAARGEIVITLDADARPPPGWIAQAIAPLGAGRADAVAGLVVFAPTCGMIGAWQTLDADLYLRLSAALSALRIDGGVLFGAFAVRRALYDQLGGFAAIGPTLTEDLAFARALRCAGGRIAYRPQLAVDVAAARGWLALVARTKRVTSSPPGPLAVVIGVWLASLPILGLAAVLGAPFAAALVVLRWTAGVAIAAAAALAAKRPALVPMALLYEAIAFALAAHVAFDIGRTNTVRWGGIDYPR